MFPCTWPTIAQSHYFVIVYLLSEHLLPTIQRQGLDLGHWCLIWCLTSKSQSRAVAERVNEAWMSLSSHLPNCVTAYTNHPFIIQRASLQRRAGLFLTRLCVLSTQYMTCSQIGGKWRNKETGTEIPDKTLSCHLSWYLLAVDAQKKEKLWYLVCFWFLLPTNGLWTKHNNFPFPYL